MSVKSLTNLGLAFGYEDPSPHANGLKDVLQQLQGLKVTVVAGAVAGNVTVTGIATTDHLIAVLHLDITGNNETDLTSEFTISAANTINNAAGTATDSDTLLVIYFDTSGA